MDSVRSRTILTDDGIKLHCLELDTVSDEMVLLVPGFSQNRVAFMQGLLPRLLTKSGLSVSVAELRGHGLSQVPSAPWSVLDHLRRDLPALAEAYRGRAIHFVGHSMGGLLGFASLAHRFPWRSVTGLAAPLRLGPGSPLVLPAALLARLFARALGSTVPMDHVLAALSGPLGLRVNGPLRWVQRVIGLSNPHISPEGSVTSVLQASNAESATVFREFLRFAMPGRRTLAGIDIERAIRAAPIPVAAIAGTADIFAPPPTVAGLLEGQHAGPRRVVSLPGAAHVDLTVGEEVARAVVQLRSFWESPPLLDRPKGDR